MVINDQFEYTEYGIVNLGARPEFLTDKEIKNLKVEPETKDPNVIHSNNICDYCEQNKDDCEYNPCSFDAPNFKGKKVINKIV
jgi:hypothetical protein